MDFGEALKALWAGNRVHREGWGAPTLLTLVDDVVSGGKIIASGLISGDEFRVMVAPAAIGSADLLAKDWAIVS